MGGLGEELVRSAREALAIARGELEPAKVHSFGDEEPGRPKVTGGPAVPRRAVHPGKVLGDELAALSLTPGDVSWIVAGRRIVTANTALRLGHWFGTGPPLF